MIILIISPLFSSLLLDFIFHGHLTAPLPLRHLLQVIKKACIDFRLYYLSFPKLTSGSLCLKAFSEACALFCGIEKLQNIRTNPAHFVQWPIGLSLSSIIFIAPLKFIWLKTLSTWCEWFAKKLYCVPAKKDGILYALQFPLGIWRDALFSIHLFHFGKTEKAALSNSLN